jgi:long-subunit fatty acid transport protein
MKKGNYRVVFSGQLSAGNNAEEVAIKLASLFSLDLNNHAHATKLAKLLSARPVVIKQGLTKQAALNYKAAMANAGAICSVQYINEIPASTSQPQEKRVSQRRRHRKDRRSVQRNSSILPDRRKTADRRQADKNPE